MTMKLTDLKPLINQAELARRLNVSKQYINLLLSGKRHNKHRIEQIKRLLASELSDSEFISEDPHIDTKSSPQ